MLEFIGRVLSAALIAVLFGYFEHKFALGVVISGLAVVLLKIRQCIPTIFAFLLAAATIGSEYFGDYAQIRTTIFAVIIVTWVFSSSVKVDDTVVKLKPMEEEIRQFLFVHNPTVLHKVDALMIKYRGREEELFERLKEKYSQKVESHENEEEASDVSSSKFMSTINEGDTKSRARIQQQIYDIIQEFDLKLLSSLPRMFADYRGREDELLALCESEYLSHQPQNAVYSPVMESTAPKSSSSGGRYGIHDNYTPHGNTTPHTPSYTGMTENKYNMVPNYQSSASALRHTPQTKGNEYSPYAYGNNNKSGHSSHQKQGHSSSTAAAGNNNGSSSFSAQKSTPMQQQQQQPQPQSGKKPLSALEQARLDARNSLQARMNQYGHH